MTESIKLSRLPIRQIQKFIESLTVTDWSPEGWSVIWVTDPQPFEGLRNNSLGAWIELSIKSYRSIGYDDYRTAYSVATNSIQSVLYGVRLFTLSIDVRSFSPSIPAIDIVESILLRVNNRQSVTANAFFTSNNLAWLGAKPSVSLNYSEKNAVDSRKVWREVVDIEMSWISAAQTVDDQGNYIKTVGEVPVNSPIGTNDIQGTFTLPGEQ